MENEETIKKEEIVRIIKDGVIFDIWHGPHKIFGEKEYKKYKRPFIAEYGYTIIIGTADYPDEKSKKV